MTKLVLVVDDHDVNRQLTMMLLDMAGHRTMEASSHDEVRACIAGAVPDIIFMDVRLPSGDGLDMVRELRSEAALARTQIFALSGDATEATLQRAKAAGCDGFLVKPIDRDELLAAVEQR